MIVSGIDIIIDFLDKSSHPEKIIRNYIFYCAYSKKLKGSLLQKQAAQLLNQELFAVQRIGLPRSGTRALDSFLYKGFMGVLK